MPDKKVTKEAGIGEALSSVLPHGKPPSAMYPTRRATPQLPSTLTIENFRRIVLLLAAADALAALPMLNVPNFMQKIGTFSA